MAQAAARINQSQPRRTAMMLLFIRVISTAARVKCPEDDLLAQRMQNPIILAHWGSARTHADTHTLIHTHITSQGPIFCFFFHPRLQGSCFTPINYPPEKKKRKNLEIARSYLTLCFQSVAQTGAVPPPQKILCLIRCMGVGPKPIFSHMAQVLLAVPLVTIITLCDVTKG